MTDLRIRPEAPADYPVIERLLIETFRASYGTGPEEAEIVAQLRGIVPCIALVAEAEGAILGYNFISPAALAEYPAVPVAVLGPIGVRADCQRQGVGSRLMREGLAAARQAGYHAIVLTGDAHYYRRFGFIPISETRLQTIFHTPHDQVLELQPGTLARVSGLVTYPEPWLKFVPEEGA